MIDGSCFSNLSEFYEHVGENLFPDALWGHNLDAFNDVLWGGFGTPDEGFNLCWKNSNISQQKLGYEETVKELKLRLLKCRPSNRESVVEDIKRAEQNIGSTVFDWLVGIIKEHERGISEDGYYINLSLE